MKQINTSFNSGWSKIFVSYCHKDATFVSRLLPCLKELSPVVIDQDDELITAGDFIPEAIINGIKECSLGLCFISKYSINSDWVRYELNEMRKLNHNGKIAIIPVLLDSYKELDIPNELVFIKDFYYCDVSDNFDPAKVVVEIKKVIDKSVDQNFPIVFCGYEVGDNLINDKRYSSDKSIIERALGKVASYDESIPSDKCCRNINYLVPNINPEIPIIYLSQEHRLIYAKPLDQSELDSKIDLIKYSTNNIWLIVTFRRMTFGVSNIEFAGYQEISIQFVDTDMKKITIIICDLTAIDNDQKKIGILQKGKEVFLSYFYKNHE